MAKRDRTPSGAVDVNMTPMIDCTFQLIIFFILTAQIANQELVRLLAPKPQESQALAERAGEPVLPNRVIVNIVNQYGGESKRDPNLSGVATAYHCCGKGFSPSETLDLTDVLKARMQEFQASGGKAEEFYLEIRGDRDVYYSDVEPVIRAATDAEFTKMSITAIADPNFSKNSGS